MNDTKYSEKTIMRISVWIELLTKACDYLVVCEKYYQKLLSSGNDLEGGIYYIGTAKTSYCDYYSITKGLSEAAVIALTSVITGSGRGSEDIAGDKEIDVGRIKGELLHRVSEKMRFPEKEFNEYCEEIKTLRNKIIAHYDAGAAEYESLGTITRRRMASATFRPREITKLKELSITLLSTLREMVGESQNCT